MMVKGSYTNPKRFMELLEPGLLLGFQNVNYLSSYRVGECAVNSRNAVVPIGHSDQRELAYQSKKRGGRLAMLKLFISGAGFPSAPVRSVQPSRLVQTEPPGSFQQLLYAN